MFPPRTPRTPHSFSRHGWRAVLAFLLLGAAGAAAADPLRFSWTTAASGNWSEATNWSDDQASGTAPLATGAEHYEIEFAVDGAFTTTQDLNAGFKLNALRFGGSEVTLTGNALQFVTNGAALPSIEQAGAATVTIDLPLSLAAELSIGGSGSGTISVPGAITGNGGLVFTGGGTLALAGANRYRGNTTVHSGTLQLTQPNPGNDASVLTLKAGATLDLAFSGSDTVASLVIGETAKPDGLYDASNSDGAITGSGSILVVTPLPSSNASLASLAVAGASLSPAFNPLTGSYSASVANGTTTVTVTPTVAGEGATVTVNGSPVASGATSAPIALAVGPNLITTLVRAQDGITTRSYTVSVNRASAAVVASAPAVVIDASRATLNGTSNPYGVSTVYFEYGTTPSLGSRTPDRDLSGTSPRGFAAALSGLKGATTYYFRAVLFNPATLITGETLQFTTAPNPPVAATGAPANVTSNTATLVGAVNPNGVPATVYFEYGLTTAYGQSTPVQRIPAGFDTVGVQAPNLPLIANAAYHYRLVASNSAGTAFGNDVLFQVREGGGSGSGAPTAAPEATTEDAIAIGTESAILQGSVNPNGGTTLVRFEYGLTPAYGASTAAQGAGNGDSPAAVAIPVQGLLPATTYHFRISASNSLGETVGGDGTFTTDAPPPTAVTGGSTVLTTTSVRIDGSVRARGATAEVWIDYGTDGISFDSVRATPELASGDQSVEVAAELNDLAQGVTYFYRVRAIGEGGEGIGEVRSFEVASLSGLIQQYPPGVAASARQGSVVVTLDPAEPGTGWRFAGEQFWRESGVPATGLTAGDRVVEYRPLPGFVQPPNEVVAVASSPSPLALARRYTATSEPGNATLIVVLKPQDLTEDIAPARWRFFGESETDWKLSGDPVGGLVPGNYVIESKPVDGRSTPAPVTATLAAGQTTSLTITYFLADAPVGTAPSVLTFAEVSGNTTLPHAFVGQLRGDAGSGTGFVVRPRVVATVGHVVFDDGTLAITTGLQWLFQRDRGVHDPAPLTPRGQYLMTGYAAQRILDDSPGVSSPQSQNLDVATLFFLRDVGRGGFSGYLASDTSTNEFLQSDALKTLVGYPVEGIAEADLDRMHATPPANVGFTKAFGRTYTSADIRATGGASGAPLCVQAENGAYYPAAVYLGGTGQTVVRAIDSEVVELIAFADASSNDGVGTSGGSLSSVTTPYDETELGGLEVVIEPAAARDAGAAWRLSTQPDYRPSGSRIDDLPPADYTLSLPVLEGFVPPAPQGVTVASGLLTTVTFTYESVVTPPLVTSAANAAGIRGEAFSYQIAADNAPALFSLSGTLPAGLDFDSTSGLISGTLGAAGVFVLDIGASNSGGADSRKLTLTSRPALADQSATRPYRVATSIPLLSSESGPGVSWSATGLPDGLVLQPATGIITGAPQVPGIYAVPITVTRLGASSTATLTLTITGIPPEFTLQPAAARSLQYGTTTTLNAAASGLPEPDYQWYEGPAGNTDVPVPGATSPVFTTPPLTANTRYWVRASSLSGNADSIATEITILPSSNANLGGIFTSEGVIAPAFNFGITAYSLTVPNDVPAIQVTPIPEVSQSSVRINGVLVPFNGASDPVELAVGPNLLNLDVTAGNGTTTRRYTLTVTRALPPSVATLDPGAVTNSTAVLLGSALPNGPATVFFQYGPSAAYGSATPGQEVAGSTTLPIESLLTGLLPETEYHYRIGLSTGGGTIFGVDKTFTTGKAPPLVATGQAIDLDANRVKLIGAVDPNGTATDLYFEYGPDANFGSTTPVQPGFAGTSVQDVEFTLEGVAPGDAIHYRLVGQSVLGVVFGQTVSFIVGQADSGTGIPVAPPEATTLAALDPGPSSAVLQARVNPRGGTTFVRFEYGTSPAYGQSTAARGIGSGTDPVTALQALAGLIAGQNYHYRVVASNSAGTTFGEDQTFSTGRLAPLATTGEASPLNVNSVLVAGSVRARGSAVEAAFEFGTDGVNFPNRIAVSQGIVSGDAEVAVSAVLTNLQPGVTYHYRAVATRTDDPASGATGAVRTFASDALIGLFQKFPRELDVIERLGEVQVNLSPPGIGKWRFVGEVEWRDSGSAATGMTTGDREIEYLPVAGRLQPAREPVGVISGAPRLVLDREYAVSASPGNSGLRVFLSPANRVAATPTSFRVKWRLAGQSEWIDSGGQLGGLMPGSYLIEFKPAQGLDAPPPATVVVGPGEIRSASFAYNPGIDAPSNSIRVLSFPEISTTRTLPYAYVGQLRTDAGSHSGFVVKPRVVATTAQAVFDETTLAQIPGMQWVFQRDREVHEARPLVPRGFYAFDGYAAQRAAENQPGFPGLAAQNLNAAAIYFAADAGRGGYSGFIATDAANRPLLDATAPKILTGYPIRGGNSTSNYGRMQATLATTGAFTVESGSVFATREVRGLSGMPGGPLCLQRGGGSYYPAAIYLGGDAKSLYRAIDASVIDLFNRAEQTANTGDNNTSGGISQTSYTAISTTSTRGALTVLLEPAEARTAGAAWKLGTDTSYVLSGSRKNSLTPGDYVLQFKPVPGFQTPPQQIVKVVSNSLLTVNFTYLPEISAVASWRIENFGSTTNTGSAADSGDPDGDGSLNIDEYSAGTDPLDRNDFFQVEDSGLVGTTFSITVPGRIGRTYTLQKRGDLGSGAWSDVTTRSGLAADGPLILQDPAATAGRGFYRVVVEVTPP